MIWLLFSTDQIKYKMNFKINKTINIVFLDKNWKMQKTLEEDFRLASFLEEWILDEDPIEKVLSEGISHWIEVK